MIISFNQFLLLKEFHYQDTFGKRDKFYLEWRRLMKNMNKKESEESAYSGDTCSYCTR